MKRFWFQLVVGLTTLSLVVSVLPAMAFNATLAPAKKTYRVERGDVVKYNIQFTNNSEEKAGDYRISVGDFFYGENGGVSFLTEEYVDDTSQSLISWTDVPETISAPAGEKVRIPVTITVPQNADYGDHLGAIFIEPLAKGESTTVGVRGRLASLVILKVIGGDAVRKSGFIEDFAIETREKARNTVTIQFGFRNTGREFFDLETQVRIFGAEDQEEPLKTIRSSDPVFPNTRKMVRISLGDLGDDYGEGDYFAQVVVKERGTGQDTIQFGTFKESFFYNVPLNSAVAGSPKVIEREIVVTPPIVEIVKELGLYIGGFIILLLVVIRLLFFGSRSGAKKSSRKRK